jgi:hypothetical protein
MPNKILQSVPWLRKVLGQQAVSGPAGQVPVSAPPQSLGLERAPGPPRAQVPEQVPEQAPGQVPGQVQVQVQVPGLGLPRVRRACQ